MSPPASPRRFNEHEYGLDDMEEDFRRKKELEATDQYLSTYKTQVERIQELEKQVAELKSTLADIESFLDDIPSMHLVYKAVREIQEDIKGTWVHELR